MPGTPKDLAFQEAERDLAARAVVWHVKPATRLAVAPDGKTLATVGPEGVKLWPVASLLPLLE